MCIIPGSVAEVPDQHGLEGIRVGDVTMTDKKNLDHHAKRHRRVLQTTPTKRQCNYNYNYVYTYM